MSFADYISNPICPHCKINKFVKRNFQIDLPKGSVMIKTLGVLAEKNTSKMSAEAKQRQWVKDHDYLLKNINKPLPPGMIRARKKENIMEFHKNVRKNRRKTKP